MYCLAAGQEKKDVSANSDTGLVRVKIDDLHVMDKGVRQVPSKSFSFIIPWLNTSLTKDVWLYFMLQPLMWVLGIEQFLPAILAPWILLKRVWLNSKLRVSRHIWVALIFWCWQLLHFFSLPPGELDLFIKSQGMMLALVSLFIVIYNVADSRERWEKLLGIIEWFGALVVFLGTIFILGVGAGEFRSVFGRLLPGGLVAGSHFFDTITMRSLGFFERATVLPRVRSTFWHPSSYASVLLVFGAVQWFQFKRSVSRARVVRLGLLALTAFNLFFTLSRTTYVAFAVMIFSLWWLRGCKYKRRLARLSLISLLVVLVLVYVFSMLLLRGAVSMSWFHDAIYKFRPYSIRARLQVYEASWQLIREKLFWGWGTAIKIEGLPSAFSAGSHGDYLNVLFQFGVPGLLLYLVFLGTIWCTLLKGYRLARQSEVKNFFAVSIALMLAMNVRQVTSELFWDVYVVSTIWGAWALGLALYSIEYSKSRAAAKDTRTTLVPDST
jgi:O-antigen ligase